MPKESCFLQELISTRDQMVENDLGLQVEDYPDGVYDIIPDDFCKGCTLASGFVKMVVEKGRIIAIKSEIFGKCINGSS